MSSSDGAFGRIDRLKIVPLCAFLLPALRDFFVRVAIPLKFIIAVIGDCIVVVIVFAS